MIGPNTFFPFLETLHWCTNFFTSCQMRSCRPFSILYFKQKWFLTFFCIWFLKLFCTCCPKKKIGFRNVALFSLRGVVAVELKVFLGDEHNYTITGHMSPFCIHLCEPPLISLHTSHSRVERQTWEEKCRGSFVNGILWWQPSVTLYHWNQNILIRALKNIWLQKFQISISKIFDHWKIS